VRIFVFFTIVIALGSCAQAYLPNVRNTPQFREGGEFQLGASIGTGIDVQTAYSFTDHVAMMANGSWVTKKEADHTRQQRFGELGLGYFNANRHMRVELFGGYGLGTSTHSAQYYFFFDDVGQKQVVATGNFQRFFIQPSIGTNNRRFNMAATMRFSAVDFTRMEAEGFVRTPPERPQLFIEPAVTGRFPLRGNIYGLFQLGVGLSADAESYFKTTPLQASVGIQINTTSLRTRVY
jgi:hypothetical protein